MTDKKSNDSRRKLLKSVAVGSGAVVAGKSLPESWSKPVINSIMLPVHAALTADTTTTTPDVEMCKPCAFDGEVYIDLSSGPGVYQSLDFFSDPLCTESNGSGSINPNVYLVSCGPAAEEDIVGCNGSVNIYDGWYFYTCPST